MVSAKNISPRYALILILIVTVALSGCVEREDTTEPANETNQVSVTQHDGLTIGFRSYDEIYQEGDQIILELDLENTGEGSAEDIETRLFGADFIAGVEPQFTGASSLRGVSVENNQEGEDTTVTWEIDNPVSLSEGSTETFPAGVRVRYGYETTVRASITVVDEDQFDGNETPVTPRVTAGPLDIEFDMTNPQTVYDDAEEDTAEITVPIRVTDRGRGEVANINGDPRPIHVMRAEFPNSDSATLECPPTVSLYDDTRRILCSANVPADVFERELTVELYLRYDYFETQRTTFSIQGR